MSLWTRHIDPAAHHEAIFQELLDIHPEDSQPERTKESSADRIDSTHRVTGALFTLDSRSVAVLIRSSL